MVGEVEFLEVEESLLSVIRENREHKLSDLLLAQGRIGCALEIAPDAHQRRVSGLDVQVACVALN
jgi:hypothetical protein